MRNDEAVSEMRQKMISDVEAKAARDFSDTRFDMLRPLARRRWLVLLSFVLLAVYGLSLYFEWPFVTLPALVAWGVSLWLLRMVVRGITDYPDEIVDERMREVRGRTYRYAYLGVMVLMSAYLVTFIVNQLLAKNGWAVPMSAAQLHDLVFPMFFAAMALPSALYAWMEPEI